MWEDKIVEEVRRIRKAHAAKFDFDLDTIFHDLKEQEMQSQRNIISFPPKHVLRIEEKRELVAT